MALRQINALVLDRDDTDHFGEEFYLACSFKISLLQQVFLCFALIGGLFVICFLYFFHQVAFAVAMKPGFIAVFAKLGGNIMPVELESRIHKKARKATAYQACNKQKRCKAVFHAAKLIAEPVKSNLVFVIVAMHLAIRYEGPFV